MPLDVAQLPGDEHHPGQDAGLAEQCHDQVDPPGTPGGRGIVVGHQQVGRKADDGIADIKACQITRQQQQAGSEQAREPAAPESGRFTEAIAPGVQAGKGPGQGGEQQQGPGEGVGTQLHAEQQARHFNPGAVHEWAQQQQWRQRRHGQNRSSGPSEHQR